MAKRKGQVVLNTLVTQDTSITFPIVDANDIGGGRHFVATIEERNAIPAKHRKAGMVVYVEADSTDYQLLAGFAATGTIADNFWKVYAPGLPAGVLTEHQKVEDIEYENPTAAGYTKLTDKLAAMDTAIDNADQDVEDILWGTTPVGTGRNSNLGTELNYLFSALSDPTKIVVGTKENTEDPEGDPLPVSLSEKLTGIDTSIATLNTTIADINDPTKIILATEGTEPNVTETTLAQAYATNNTDISDLKTKVNIEPKVDVFEIQTNVYEVGATVSSITVNWAFNKLVSAAVLKVNGSQIADLAVEGVVATVGTKTIGELNITTDTTITVEITDGDNRTATKNATIVFKNKLLYGTFDASTTEVTQALMETLTASGLLDTPFNKYVRVDCGANGDKVPVIAVASDLGVDETQITFTNGYATSWTKSTVSYTNASGGVVSYDVFVFDEALVDKVVMALIEVI